MPAHNPLIGGVQYVPTTAGIPPNPGDTSASFDGMRGAAIDGTPVRVVVMAFAAAGALAVLRMSGVRFNVGVS